MAIRNDDGSFSGRMGDYVYYKRNGKNLVRKYVKPKDPKTDKQKENRAKLTCANHFFSSFTNVIKIGYQGSEHSSGFFEAIQYHIKNALQKVSTEINNDDPVYEIVLSKVKLSRGLIESPVITEITRSGQQIFLKWQNNLGSKYNRHNDSLAIVAYSPGHKVFTDFHVGERFEGSESIYLPGDFIGDVGLWVFYWNGQKKVSPSEKNVSDSVWVGCF